MKSLWVLGCWFDKKKKQFKDFTLGSGTLREAFPTIFLFWLNDLMIIWLIIEIIDRLISNKNYCQLQPCTGEAVWRHECCAGTLARCSCSSCSALFLLADRELNLTVHDTVLEGVILGLCWLAVRLYTDDSRDDRMIVFSYANFNWLTI